MSIEAWRERFAMQGRYMIRQQQFIEANKGHGPLLRWLGIQELGQRTKVDILQKAADEAKDEAKEDRTKGFKLFVPGSLATIDQQSPQQAHDQVPEVENILKIEKDDGTSQGETGTKEAILVPAYSNADET